MCGAFAAFSDESRHTDARYRSIACVSLPAGRVATVEADLRRILHESNVCEFKWHDLESARMRFCAIKFIDYLLDVMVPNEARVDVLTWDVQDRRHDVIGRDDIKNFERMFFHLHRNVMMRREAGAFWHLRPDERVDVDWRTLKSCLGSVGRWPRYLGSLLDTSYSDQFFDVHVQQVASDQCRLCQLADLFAGMGAYSRERAETMKALKRESSGQLALIDGDEKPPASQRDTERFRVISHLYDRCRERKLGVSFETEGYLRTRDPRNPVNFWHYEPQSDKDKAPTRDA